MLQRFVRYFWGDLDRNEVQKFGLLSLTFFFLIGSYWLLRTQKDGIFDIIVGYKEYQPLAKIYSLGVVAVVLMIYAKLVDMFDKDKLLIMISMFFATGLIGIAYFLNDPVIGIANTVRSPDRYFGWIVYFFIECFGSTMVGLFWSVVSSTTKTESAKRGYPIIIAGAQFGSILGSLGTAYTAKFGNVLLFRIGAACVAGISIMVLVYLHFVPVEYRTGEGKQEEKKETGILEGLKIILTRPYVAGILVLSTVYEVISTISEYQMKSIFRISYPTGDFDAFNGWYGVLTNGLALVMAAFGTSKLMRSYGLRFCLMLFPAITGVVMIALYFFPILYVAIFTVVVIKGLSYALNNPSKEMMYIPTTKDVKFKAKSLIDGFGSRSSKAVGSTINKVLPAFGTAVSLGIVLVWLAVASYVGNKFNDLTKKGEQVS